MKNPFSKIFNRGIKDDDPIEVRRQIGLLNTATLCCFITLSFFILLNIYQQNWKLLINNTILFILASSLLFISKLKIFNKIIVALCILFTLYFFANAFLLHNALQYAILAMMVVSVLLINSNIWRIIVLALQIGLYMLFLFFQDRPAIIPPLPAYRNYIVTFSMLSILALILQYFKSRQLQYIKNLSSLNSQLQDSNKVKERMLSILSHDFNAPVANLVSTLNLIDAEILTQQQFNEISIKLQSQLNVLTTSLGDVLQWSKMQLSGDAGKPETVNIKHLLDELLTFFQYAIDAKKLHAENMAGPSTQVYANKSHLTLIFRNLLSNAIKFSYPSKAVLITSVLHNDMVLISIADEGTGMQPKVLQALQQQSDFNTVTGTANEKGTGIGLVLVREFLQKNNGALSIDSTYGTGSTFTVSLPGSMYN